MRCASLLFDAESPQIYSKKMARLSTAFVVVLLTMLLGTRVLAGCGDYVMVAGDSQHSPPTRTSADMNLNAGTDFPTPSAQEGSVPCRVFACQESPLPALPCEPNLLRRSSGENACLTLNLTVNRNESISSWSIERVEIDRGFPASIDRPPRV